MHKKKERGLGSMQKREHFTLHEKYSYGNTGLYKLCHPAILPSWMGEHGVNWEDMENMENTESMEKMENIN